METLVPQSSDLAVVPESHSVFKQVMSLPRVVASPAQLPEVIQGKESLESVKIPTSFSFFSLVEYQKRLALKKEVVIARNEVAKSDLKRHPLYTDAIIANAELHLLNQYLDYGKTMNELKIKEEELTKVLNCKDSMHACIKIKAEFDLKQIQEKINGEEESHKFITEGLANEIKRMKKDHEKIHKKIQSYDEKLEKDLEELEASFAEEFWTKNAVV